MAFDIYQEGAKSARSNAQAQSYPQEPQVEFGVRSALQQLIEEAGALGKSSQELRNTLGISVPEQSAPKPPPSGNLVGLISEVTDRIRSANYAINDSLRHLTT